MSAEQEFPTTAAVFLPPHKLWEAIVDSSDDAIVTKNLFGIVQSWNKSAERIFGYTAEEMIGQPIQCLLPPDRKDEEDRILARLRRGERVDHYETRRMRKDGRLIDVSLTISPVRDDTGKVVGASKIARDITAQKLAMVQLTHAHGELKRVDQMKTEFFATLSHELRTPLNAIMGWIQLLEDNPTPEDVEEGVQVIKRNVRMQTQLIEDMLDMSRIEAGKVTLDIQRVDLPAIVSAAMDSVRPAAEAKGIRLTSAFSSVEGIVTGDKGRLQQVIWNLLNNAVKFTPRGGRVHITIERVNSHVEIKVTDSGIGIAAEMIDQIFERFRQADASTTRKYGGLGLGLSIVKHLVELHGGTARAWSEGEGHGSTFTVSLPLIPVRHDPELTAVAARNAAVDKIAPPLNLSGLDILAVDDDADSVDTIRRILERHGAKVRPAQSMNEALAAFAERTPDILVSDVGMPEHDGYELIARVRALPAGRSVPAVALTALARTEDRNRALRAGFQVHIAKPVDAGELAAVIRGLIDLRNAPR